MSGRSGARIAPAILNIVLLGKPEAWRRAGYNRQTGVHFKQPADVNYQGLIRAQAVAVLDGRAPICNAIELSVLAVFPIPPSWTKSKQAAARQGLVPHVTKPDLDNILKNVKDALSSVAYTDDKLIARYSACAKVYGEQPRLEIRLRQITVWGGDEQKNSSR